MKFVKIENFINMFGQPDYKKLSINEFVAGSQLHLVNENQYIFATNEDVQAGQDVVLISEEDYMLIRETMLSKEPEYQKGISDDVEELKQKLTEQAQTIMTQEQAIAELSMIVGSLMQ